MQSHVQRVTALPELLAMIVHELDSAEKRRLMCVSRYLFSSVGPTAWKSVPRLDLVMMLVKGVQIEIVHTSYRERRRCMTLVIKFPVNPDLGRYDIYAPWVQELEIYGGYHQRMENFDPLLLALAGRPPLPNLRRIAAYSTALINGDDLLRYFNMFVNPLLTEIYTTIPKDGFPQICGANTPSSVSAFLEKLETTCPEIRVLEFYLGDNDASHPPEELIPSGQCWSRLSSFINLRSFSSNNRYVLESTIFGMLGELPHLESLGIRGSDSSMDAPILNKKLSIPATWFPVLKDLRLYVLHDQDVQVLWKQPTITEKLVSTEIQVDVSGPLRENWVGPFLRALRRCYPHLENVFFSMNYMGGTTEIPRDDWDHIIGGDLFLAYAVYRASVQRQRILMH